MDQLDTNGYYAFGVPAYLALMALEQWWELRRGRAGYPFAASIGSLSTGLSAVILGLFFGPYLVGLYDFGMTHIAVIHWQEGSIVPWILGVVVSDFCYYWHHRAGHRIGALWAIHGVHHQAAQFDLTVAMRHPWFSDLYAVPFYALMPLLGVPAKHFFIGISIVSFYALSIHTFMLDRPNFYIFVTPRTHVVHHARNRRYLGMNLGAMFTVWDRMFGTHVEPDPDDPIELGTPAGYTTHNGVWSQFVLWRDLLSAVRATRGIEKLAPFFGRPGWWPSETPRTKRTVARSELAINRVTKGFVLALFSITLLISVHLLWFRATYSVPQQAIVATAVVTVLWLMGWQLDGRGGSNRDPSTATPPPG